MIVRINLLPYRQIKRAERQRQFNLLLLATFVAGAAVVFLGHSYVSNHVDRQNSRNQRLEEANRKLDQEISDIKTLKAKIDAVLARKRVVENLQTDRSQAVILLDEIARQLPEGVYLTSLKQEGGSVTLEGIADTNARVASLVRNLNSSSWLELPQLIEIKSMAENNLRKNAFVLKVKQKENKPAESDNPKPKAGKS